jgi:type IV pilus biogenesis protein PilP
MFCAIVAAATLAHAQGAASAPLVDANRVLPAAPPAETTAIVNTLHSSGRAPTVETLSNAQRLEIDAEVRKRMTNVLTPPSTGAAASAPVTPQVISYPTRPEPVPPPDTTKKVLAIYGPVGQEVADIQLPNGSVMTARVGSSVQGYQVLRITAQSAELAVPAGNNTSSKGYRGRKAQTPSNGPKVRGEGGGKGTELAAGTTIRVAVGGTFK